MTTASPGEVLARLERELRDMWTVPAEPGAVPLARACTMNLLVVAGSVELAARYTPVIDEVSRQIPARAIVVALDPDSDDAALEGETSAVCPVGEAICSERVTLTAHGVMCARIASALDALLVPELPTTLVWLGRVHVDDPVFVDLARNAQRVVLDTEYTSLASLIHLVSWVRAAEGRPTVADLAWTRLAVWQEMCARFFDEPELREHALHVTQLDLEQASEPHTRLGSEGALLLGWLATRLDWRPVRLGGSLRFRRPDGGHVDVRLGTVPRPPEVAPATLAAVRFRAEHNGLVTRATLERELASGPSAEEADRDVLVWRLDVDVPSATEQRVRLRTNRGAYLLERTLRRPTRDDALGESVAFAGRLLEDDLVCE